MRIRSRLAQRLVSFVSVLAIGMTLAGGAGAQEQIKRGGTLVVSLPGEPQSLNPAITTHLPTRLAASNMFNSLIYVGPDQKIRPDLAESWEMSSDGMTYTFHLARNAKWHDGKPFTSADVKFSLNEVNRKYDGPATTGFSMVKDIETPDPYTVVFTLQYPFPAFFPWSFTNVWIMPQHIYAGSDPTRNNANFKPVGTGPFMFREWTRGSHLTLDRNPNYFKAGKPYVDRLVFKVIPDASARVIALESNDVDHLNFLSMPSTAVADLRKNSNITVKLDRSRVNYGIIIAHFNLRNQYLQNKQVRQAIGFAINQKEVIDKALDGLADVSTGPISPQQADWYNPNVPRYSFEPAKSNAMLDAAGFPRGANGVRFALRISYDRTGEGGSLQSAAEIMRENLKTVGVDLQLQPLDGATWMEGAHVKWDFDISMGSYQTGPDPSVGVSRLYITKNIARRIGTNLMGYSNPKVDDLFEKTEREVDPGKRKQLIDEVQAVIVDDLPAYWLWAKVAPIASWNYVRGDLPPGSTHLEPMENVWIADRKR
jgi:peptide/nickel transport system substrate-binding protein